MLITKKIKIKMNRGNLGYYNKVMNIKYKINDEVDIPIELIPKGMTVKVIVSCDICKKENEITYRSYINSLKYGFYSCHKCKHIKRKMTNSTKYNDINFNNIEKRKKTHIEKYGCYYNNRDKSKLTCEERYGFDNVSKVKSIRDKKEETMLNRWGVINPTYIESINFINSIEGYVRHNVDEKTHTIKCKEGHLYDINTNLFYSRYYRGINTCTICNKLDSVSSSYESLIFDFINENYDGDIIQSYRDKYEIDIFIPQFNLGIEINGLYWHSSKFKEKNYHLNKTKYFEKKGIRIVHIWEDDIIFKCEIIKSILLNLIKKSKRIFARQCEIREINDSFITKGFLEENHIQGFNNNIKKAIGLFYNNELVSLMCFNDLEGRKRIKDNGFNINRFCNKLNTSVVGGASKLLKFFIHKYNPKYIISYADYSFSKGDLYFNLGFNIDNITYPDYKYVVGSKRIHKSNFKKEKLGIKNENISEREFTELNNIYRIYDCGKIKYKMIL